MPEAITFIIGTMFGITAMYYIQYQAEKQQKKKVYIAHPLRNDIDNNIQKVNEICKNIAKNLEVVPISPIHAFGFIDPLGDQEQVFGYCRAMLEGCSELWVFGDWWKSEGCLMEIKHADKCGIPVVFQQYNKDAIRTAPMQFAGEVKA